MRRVLPTLALIVLMLCALSVPAGAWQDGDTIGTLTHTLRALARETPYLTSCELGSRAADAIREAAGTQLALVSAADLAGDLPNGTLTWADVFDVFSSDRMLAAAEVTPAELFALLEAAVSHIELDTETELVVEGSEIFGGFCQIAGFAFTYDVSAPVGERVVTVLLEDGTELLRGDETTVLTLAAPVELLDGTLGLPLVEYRTLEITQAEALAAYIAEHPTLPESKTDRITMIGARNKPLISMFPSGTLAAGVAVLVVILAFYRMRYSKIKEEYGTNQDGE